MDSLFFNYGKKFKCRSWKCFLRSRTKYLGNQWLRYLTPRAKELGIGFLQLTDIRHNWGVRSIHAGLDARVASKSLGHSINTHYEIYNSTYEQIDAIKASKKLNK